MSDLPHTEVVRRVYDPYGDGYCLTIRPWPDGPGDTLELCTVSAADIEGYGDISVPLSPDMARALAHALLASVRDLTATTTRDEE